jgi:ABC-type sugar transport system substrate-binding protein
MLKFFAKATLFFCFLFLAQFSVTADEKYSVGFSQCTTSDYWRQSMQRVMEIELAFYPDLQLKITDAHDDTELQIQQIDELIKGGIDLLIVSPNESAPITPIVEKVYNSGIPVIVIDRKVNTSKYSAYVGGNN